MVGFRRTGRGRVSPIVGRQAHVATVVCRKCRRFCGASLAAYAAQAKEQAEAAGWADVEDGLGTCPDCKDDKP